MKMSYSYTTKEGEERERKDKDKREDGDGEVAGGCQDERSLADEEEIEEKLKGGEREEGRRE